MATLSAVGTFSILQQLVTQSDRTHGPSIFQCEGAGFAPGRKLPIREHEWRPKSLTRIDRFRQ
jgi:hypothetical protein